MFYDLRNLGAGAVGVIRVDDGVAYVRLVGVSFYQEALVRCAPGEAVQFVHEPDNPHDEMAIRVVSVLGETIGYVPRRSWLHRAVHEQGRGVSGVISSVGRSRACLLGATISVAVCDDEPAVRSYFADQPAPEPPKGGFRYWVTSPSDAAQLAAARR
jgi:hypothetical protein